MIESPSNRSMSNTRCLKPGVILKEQYKIEEVIGAGGFGITYRAWDPLLQSYVAIKEYYPSGIATRSADSSKVCVPVGQEQREYHRGRIRFLKEAQDVARFQSEPNIVSIYDYLEENDTAYMVMEYLHGCTLKQYIREHGGRLDTDHILHICLSVLDALAVVHKAGMIHRDISPENIFICEDLTVKLIDFGAAKQVYLDGEQTMSVVLKPGYAPPEQYAKKDKQGPWTDIYALGATLYFAATGEKPEESFGRVLEDTIKPVCEVNPEIPRAMSQVIMRAMSVKIEDRYQTVEAMREAFACRRGAECADGAVCDPSIPDFKAGFAEETGLSDWCSFLYRNYACSDRNLDGGACSEEGRDGNSNRNECSIDRGADSNDGGCTDCHGR